MKALFGILFALILIVVSCSNNNTIDDNQMTNDSQTMGGNNIEFKKMCQEEGYDWMLMNPTKDGKIMHDKDPCWGCMVEGIEHVCDMKTFMEITR